MKVGDIVVVFGGKAIDQNGNYVDPLYGKIEFTNLITARAFAGDTMPMQVQRDGKAMQLNLALDHRAADDYVIPPYNIDRAPLYYVLGGLIFQELSRQYLREWGGNWLKDAPQRFVSKDRFQSELYPDGNRRVVVLILTQVLPANVTIAGCDEGADFFIKMNGRSAVSWRQMRWRRPKLPSDGFIEIETKRSRSKLTWKRRK